MTIASAAVTTSRLEVATQSSEATAAAFDLTTLCLAVTALSPEVTIWALDLTATIGELLPLPLWSSWIELSTLWQKRFGYSGGS